MNDNQQIPVTKDVLKAFGDKAKRIFKHQPVIVDAQNGSIIKIATSLNYGATGPQDLSLDISGLSTVLDNKTVIKSSLICHAASAVLDSGHIINYGSEKIICAALIRDNGDREGLLTIYIVVSNSIDSAVIDLLTSKDGIVSSNETIVEARTISSSSVEEADSFIQIYESVDDRLYEGDSAGHIINSASFDPSFTIRESDNVTKSYPEYDEFDKIQHSDDTKKLDHDLIFEYDYDHTLGDGEQTQVGNLASRLRIPLPQMLANGATANNLQSINVRNGVVIGGSTTLNIPSAGTLNRGGILLGTDKRYPDGQKAWVQLDSESRAFVDLASQDIHRGDLASDEYQGDNIANYEGKIFQHIGATTDDYIEGYFYKCAKSGYSVSRQDSGTPYTMDTQAGSKLEQLIIDKGWPLVPNSSFTVYVDQGDYNALATITENRGTEQNPEIVHTKTFNDLDTFKIKNTDSDVSYTLTKQELNEGVGIYISPEWQDSLLADYSYTIASITFEVTSSSWKWRQWDVQPRGESGSCGCDRITEEEIDALFLTYVNHIEISEGTAISGEPGDILSLHAVVGPQSADDKHVDWVSNNTNVAIVQSLSDSEARVLCGEEGVAIITASATAHPLREPQIAQITVTVQQNSLNVIE